MITVLSYGKNSFLLKIYNTNTNYTYQLFGKIKHLHKYMTVLFLNIVTLFTFNELKVSLKIVKFIFHKAIHIHETLNYL